MVELDTGENRRYAWTKRSREIKERDGDTCLRCGEKHRENGSYNTTIYAHHIVPGRELPKPDARIGLNLVTVCTSCHAKIEGEPPREQFAQCQRKVAALALDMLADGRCTPGYIAEIADVPKLYVKIRLEELVQLRLARKVHQNLYELGPGEENQE